MSADISNPLLTEEQKPEDVLVNASKGLTGSQSATTAWQQYGDNSTSTASTAPETTSNDSGSETNEQSVKTCMGKLCELISPKKGGRTKKSKKSKSKKSKSKKSKSKKSKSKKSKSKKSKSKKSKSKKSKSRKSKKC